MLQHIFGGSIWFNKTETQHHSRLEYLYDQNFDTKTCIKINISNWIGYLSDKNQTRDNCDNFRIECNNTTILCSQVCSAPSYFNHKNHLCPQQVHFYPLVKRSNYNLSVLLKDTRVTTGIRTHTLMAQPPEVSLVIRFLETSG